MKLRSSEAPNGFQLASKLLLERASCGAKGSYFYNASYFRGFDARSREIEMFFFLLLGNFDDRNTQAKLCLFITLYTSHCQASRHIYE